MTEPMILETKPGDYLPHVIARALEKAKGGTVVRFTFNDATVDVREGQTADEVRTEITRQWDAAAEAYRNSPAGIASAKRQEEELRVRQLEHDVLMSALDASFTAEPSIIDWLKRYSAVADDIRITHKDYPRVVQKLEAAGYKAKDALGLEKEAYRDRKVLARWLIGQAIDMMKSGMPPHPAMMHKFAEEYHAAEGEGQ